MKKRRPGTVKHRPVLTPVSIYRVGNRVGCRLCLGSWDFEDNFKAAEYAALHAEVHAESRS